MRQDHQKKTMMHSRSGNIILCIVLMQCSFITQKISTQGATSFHQVNAFLHTTSTISTIASSNRIEQEGQNNSPQHDTAFFGKQHDTKGIRKAKNALILNVMKNNTVPTMENSFYFGRSSNSINGGITDINKKRTLKTNAAFHPRDIEIASRSQGLEDIDDENDSSDGSYENESYPFVGMLRNSANYIANHRHTATVFHIPGELLEWKGFPALLEDITLSWLLGMRIVIVVGCSYQVNNRVTKTNGKAPYVVNTLQPTDLETMRIATEEAGYVRFELERQLNRCLQLHGGADLRDPGALNSNVVSGNFYVAEPVGYVDGVDFGYTGFPSFVNAKKIRAVQDNNDVVLLTSCTMSPSGEQMKVKSETLAAHVAASMGASKLVYCSNRSMVLRNKENGKPIQNFRLQDAKNLLAYNDITMDEHFLPRINSDSSHVNEMSQEQLQFVLEIGCSTLALEHGVERAHIIAPSDGALITELFTAKDGSATCISKDEVEKIHEDENFFGEEDLELN